jgi:hypothetical protein
MRFSIRLLLSMMAYVALVCATIATQSRFLEDLIWAVPLVGGCFAIVVACIDRGKRQAMAIGFVAMVATHIAIMYLAPYRLPAIRLYEIAGYATVREESHMIYKVVEDPSTKVTRFREATGKIPSVRTSNGVFTLAAGLIGCLIGGLAYGQKCAFAPNHEN